MILEATIPASRLGRGIWSLAFRPAPGTPFEPIEARLLTGARQPISLIPGPVPKTRLPEPSPTVRALPDRVAGGCWAGSSRRSDDVRGGNAVRKVRVGGAPPAAGTVGPDHGVTGSGAEVDPGRRERRRAKRQPRSGPLAGLESLVPSGRGRAVLILAHSSQRNAMADWLVEFQHDQVTVISEDDAPEWGLFDAGADQRIAPTLAKVNSSARMLGGLDVIVDLLPSDHLPRGAEDRSDVFAAVFRYLKLKGAYVLDRRADPRPSLDGLNRWLELATAADDRERLKALRGRQAAWPGPSTPWWCPETWSWRPSDSGTSSS